MIKKEKETETKEKRKKIAFQYLFYYLNWNIFLWKDPIDIKDIEKNLCKTKSLIWK